MFVQNIHVCVRFEVLTAMLIKIVSLGYSGSENPAILTGLTDPEDKATTIFETSVNILEDTNIHVHMF